MNRCIQYTVDHILCILYALMNIIYSFNVHTNKAHSTESIKESESEIVSAHQVGLAGYGDGSDVMNYHLDVASDLSTQRYQDTTRFGPKTLNLLHGVVGC